MKKMPIHELSRDDEEDNDRDDDREIDQTKKAFFDM